MVFSAVGVMVVYLQIPAPVATNPAITTTIDAQDTGWNNLLIIPSAEPTALNEDRDPEEEDLDNDTLPSDGTVSLPVEDGDTTTDNENADTLPTNDKTNNELSDGDNDNIVEDTTTTP